MKQFTTADLAAINDADDLKISPFREDGVTYGTPTWIWAVVVDRELFVRAYSGVASRWFKSAMKQHAGRIHAAGKVFDVVFEAGQGSLHAVIDEAYKKKYSKSPYLKAMISERASAATVRIRLK
jgi:hypothetical protein